MSRRAIEHRLEWNWTPRRVMRSLLDVETNVIVTRDEEGGLVGFGIMHYGDDDAHLLLLAVRAAQRRRGYGSALLEWLEASAFAAGLHRIRLETRRGNASARAFYERHGYGETGIREAYYQGIEDAICMTKRIGAA